MAYKWNNTPYPNYAEQKPIIYDDREIKIIERVAKLEENGNNILKNIERLEVSQNKQFDEIKKSINEIIIENKQLNKELKTKINETNKEVNEFKTEYKVFLAKAGTIWAVIVFFISNLINFLIDKFKG